MRALRGMSGIYHISAIVETYNLRGVPEVPLRETSKFLMT